MAMAAALTRQRPNIWWLALLQGIAAILLGFMLFTAPGATLVTLITFLGFYWLITGVLAVVSSAVVVSTRICTRRWPG